MPKKKARDTRKTDHGRHAADPLSADLASEYSRDLAMAALSLESFLASCKKLGINVRSTQNLVSGFVVEFYQRAAEAGITELPHGVLSFEWYSAQAARDRNAKCGVYQKALELNLAALALRGAARKRLN